ncbi:cupin domain-containing protein [Aeromicrobium sp.]|uniref:cupin domain-containing protein n=1 Tax=Aeromicrobium sp. TaxID=1871063 RepID=UPI0030C4AF68
MNASPVLVRADQAESVVDGPTSLITLLADAPETGGAVTINRATLAVGSPGAPPHSHSRAAESFFVLDGELQVLVDDTVIDLAKGDFLLVPPGVTHAFAPPAGKEADVLVTFTPGMRRFDYYRLLGRVHTGEADASDLAACSVEFDNHYAVSDTWADR